MEPELIYGALCSHRVVDVWLVLPRYYVSHNIPFATLTVRETAQKDIKRRHWVWLTFPAIGSNLPVAMSIYPVREFVFPKPVPQL